MGYEYKKDIENCGGGEPTKIKHLEDMNWTCAKQRFVELKHISELKGILGVIC